MRNKYRMRKSYIMLLVSVMVICTAVIGLFTVNSSAHMDDIAHQTKIYQSIQIESGDSLWSISETYAKEFGCSTKEYMNELRQINGLTTDQIHSGAYLTIVTWKE